MILGIHDGHDAGAAIIDDNSIYAINEERLNREKYYRGFPTESVKKVIEISNVKPEEIDNIAVAGIYRKKKRLNRLYDNLKKILGPVKDKIITVEHHKAHASSAYYTSGWKNGVILTIDAAGDGISMAVFMGKNYKMVKIGQSSYLDSLGDFYASITEMLGFIPMRHEGKIMALSAYSDKEDYYDFSEYLETTGISFNNKKKVTGTKSMKKIADNIDYPLQRKDEISNLLRKGKLNHKLSSKAIQIAASAQNHLENVLNNLCNNIKSNRLLNDDLKDNIAYAGGLAQNVKGNAVINNNFSNTWIFPHMGDGGLALGAALYLDKNLNDSKTYRMNDSVKNVYLGPKFSNSEVKKVLKNSVDLNFRKVSNIAREVGNLVAEGNIISLFQGRMEYGPRALGNRSIIADPSKLSLKERLNDSLGREPFQPFAPTILDDYVEDYLQNPCNNKFMTMSFDVTEEGEKDLKAAIHIDDTSRPQILTKKDNERFYDIIKSFKRETGIGAVLNTSFNMHGEPIVCTPRNAVNSFKKSNLDYLAIENYIAEKK